MGLNDSHSAADLDLANLPIYVAPSAPEEAAPVRIVAMPEGPILFQEDLMPWDLQPGESTRAFAAFNIYLTLGPEERTLSKTYFEFYRKDPTKYGYSPNVIGKWSMSYRWVERVRAYDAHLENKMRAHLEQRRLASRIATADLGQHLREAALEALGGLTTTLFVIENVTDPETGEITQKKVLKSALSPNEIAKLAETGAKLERLALELDATGGGPSLKLTVGVFSQVVSGDLREEAREVLDSQDEVIEVTARLLSGES